MLLDRLANQRMVLGFDGAEVLFHLDRVDRRIAPPPSHDDYNSGQSSPVMSSSDHPTELLGDVDHKVLDAGMTPLPPVGLEPAADRVNSAGQVEVQSVEVLAGSVAHLDSVLGPRPISCSLPEPACRGQMTKTHSRKMSVSRAVLTSRWRSGSSRSRKRSGPEVQSA